MRDPERVRERAGAAHGLGRAAGLRPVGALVRPELQRDRDDFRPALALEQRRHGGVHPAGERHQHPFAVRGRRGDALARATASAERARPSASPTSSAAWRPAGSGRRPARAMRSAPSAAASSTSPPSTSSQAAAAQALSAAQPSASKVARRPGHPQPAATGARRRRRSTHRRCRHAPPRATARAAVSSRAYSASRVRRSASPGVRLARLRRLSPGGRAVPCPGRARRVPPAGRSRARGSRS